MTRDEAMARAAQVMRESRPQSEEASPAETYSVRQAAIADALIAVRDEALEEAYFVAAEERPHKGMDCDCGECVGALGAADAVLAMKSGVIT